MNSKKHRSNFLLVDRCALLSFSRVNTECRVSNRKPLYYFREKAIDAGRDHLDQKYGCAPGPVSGLTVRKVGYLFDDSPNPPREDWVHGTHTIDSSRNCRGRDLSEFGDLLKVHCARENMRTAVTDLTASDFHAAYARTPIWSQTSDRTAWRSTGRDRGTRRFKPASRKVPLEVRYQISAGWRSPGLHDLPIAQNEYFTPSCSWRIGTFAEVALIIPKSAAEVFPCGALQTGWLNTLNASSRNWREWPSA